MVFTAALTAALAVLFAVSLWHKLQDFRRFMGLVADYRLAPANMTFLLSVMIVGLEGAALVYLLLNASIGLVIAAGLLGLYAAGMGINLMRGRRHIDCGCYAPGARRNTIHWGMVGRNLLLVMLALGVAVSGPVLALSTLTWLDGITIAAGALCLALVYAALETGLSNLNWGRPGS